MIINDVVEYYKSNFIKQFYIDFGHGYAPREWDGLYQHLLLKGHKKSDIISTGLVIDEDNKPYDKLRNRIIFIDLKKGVISGISIDSPIKIICCKYKKETAISRLLRFLR